MQRKSLCISAAFSMLVLLALAGCHSMEYNRSYYDGYDNSIVSARVMAGESEIGGYVPEKVVTNQYGTHPELNEYRWVVLATTRQPDMGPKMSYAFGGMIFLARVADGAPYPIRSGDLVKVRMVDYAADDFSTLTVNATVIERICRHEMESCMGYEGKFGKLADAATVPEASVVIKPDRRAREARLLAWKKANGYPLWDQLHRFLKPEERIKDGTPSPYLAQDTVPPDWQPPASE